MPKTARGRLGIFTEAELEEAERLGHLGFLVKVGVGPPTRGKFRIDDKATRRRIWAALAAMSEKDFNDAWERGHIQFLADAWGCTPAYFRNQRGMSYVSRPGWRRTRQAETAHEFSRAAAVRALNATLQTPNCLGGVFLPSRHREQFDFMFVAEMPAMSEPKGGGTSYNFNFQVTKRDEFLQHMMMKYGVDGSYVTDIVKRRDIPRSPSKIEVEKWLPFLLSEVALLRPRAIIVLGRRTYEHTFRPFVQRFVPVLIPESKVEWVFHYGSPVPRDKFEERFGEVIACLRKRFGSL